MTFILNYLSYNSYISVSLVLFSGDIFGGGTFYYFALLFFFFFVCLITLY